MGRTNNNRQGIFPFNRVKPAEASLDDFLTPAPEEKAAPEAEPQIIEDRIDKADVKVVEPVPNFNQDFEVKLNLSSGMKLVGVKKMRDFRVLNLALNGLTGSQDKIMGLDRTERVNTTIPLWADNIFLDNHFVGPKMRDRASILSDWLSRIGSDSKIDFLIAFWLDETVGFSVHEGVKKDVKGLLRDAHGDVEKLVADEPEIVLTLFRWHKKDDNDISLEKGELLSHEGKSEFPGWWIGEKVNGDRGLFPHNYVKAVVGQDKQEFLHPELVTRKKSLPPVPTDVNTFANQDFGIGTAQDHNEYEQRANLSREFAGPKKGMEQKPRQRQKITEYRLCCTEAFDELLEDGLTIEEEGKLATFTGLRDTPAEGDTVTVFYNGYIWEPQKQELLEFASSDKLVSNKSSTHKAGPLIFMVGADEAIEGVEDATKKMILGQSVRVTLTPGKAYQDVGFPPDIPGDAYLVYDLRLDNIKRGNGTTGNNIRGETAGAARSAVVNRGASFRGFVPGGAALASVTHKERSMQGGVDPQLWKKKMTLVQLQKVVQKENYYEYGIDPEIIEEYLTEAEFIKAFLLAYSSWHLLAPFQRREKKKKVGLC